MHSENKLKHEDLYVLNQNFKAKAGSKWCNSGINPSVISSWCCTCCNWEILVAQTALDGRGYWSKQQCGVLPGGVVNQNKRSLPPSTTLFSFGLWGAELVSEGESLNAVRCGWRKQGSDICANFENHFENHRFLSPTDRNYIVTLAACNCSKVNGSTWLRWTWRSWRWAGLVGPWQCWPAAEMHKVIKKSTHSCYYTVSGYVATRNLLNGLTQSQVDNN